MKRSLAFFTALLILGTIIFAAPKAQKTSKKAPSWIDDPKTVYPEEKYLARTGNGISEQAARAAALAAISGFFKTQVASNAKSTTKISDKNGDISKQRTAEQEILVQTQMDLIGVDYSETYYNKNEDKYYACAFIDRNIAWTSVEPDVNKYLNKYESLYNKALMEKEQILRYKYLFRSQAAGEELIERLYFGFLINPAKRTEYQEKIDQISNDAIFGTLGEQSIPLYMNIKGDQGGIMASALNEIFKEFGFTVSTKKVASQKYVLNVDINTNEEWSDYGDEKMVAVFPNVEIKLANISSGEEFYTWKKSYPRAVNFTVEKAMQRIFKEKIVPEVQKEIPGNYRSKLMTE